MSDPRPAPAYGRTEFGAARHIVRLRPWRPVEKTVREPALGWCGAALIRDAGEDDGPLCGGCERAYVAAEDRARALGPCPRDTDGDGDCGQPFCPHCGALR